jgi:hypothetical protein
MKVVGHQKVDNIEVIAGEQVVDTRIPAAFWNPPLGTSGG